MAVIFKSAGLATDQKARLLVKDPSIFDGEGIMAPLFGSKGVVFPYSPNIQISHDANYGTYDTTHSNYQAHYYTNSPNPSVSLTAQFTAQTFEEARHTAASMHFFKSMTKMNFGQTTRDVSSSARAGLPPPVLLLTAYGNLHMKNVPVVLKSYSYTLPEDVDYITFDWDGTGNNISVPASVLISLQFGVQYNPEKTKEFDIRSYRRGDTLSGNTGWM